MPKRTVEFAFDIGDEVRVAGDGRPGKVTGRRATSTWERDTLQYLVPHDDCPSDCPWVDESELEAVESHKYEFTLGQEVCLERPLATTGVVKQRDVGRDGVTEYLVKYRCGATEHMAWFLGSQLSAVDVPYRAPNVIELVCLLDEERKQRLAAEKRVAELESANKPEPAASWRTYNTVAASLLAAHYHANQLRMDGSPYMLHPKRVAERVAAHPDATQEMICAAYLHDAVEDTSLTLEGIEAVLGPDVARLVSELTNPSKGSSAPRVERKRQDVAHLAAVSREAKIIKLVDRIDNLRDVGGEDDWRRMYAEESKALCDAVRDADVDLAGVLDREIERWCTVKPTERQVANAQPA